METVSAKKNTIRWSPTRALLWERWRTSGWLALGACAVPWVGGVLLLLNPTRALAEFLSIVTLLAFVALAIVLLVHRSGRDLAMGIPAHQLRLPVRTARLALLNYGYALFWVALFIVPPAVIAQISPSLRVTGWSFHLGNLIICAILVIVFVWAHVVSWTPVVRRSALLFGVALALAAMPLGLVLVVLYISETPHLFGGYEAHLWCLAGLGFAVAGYFASWGMLSLERRHTATTGGELAFSTPQSTSTRREPFESPLHAQVWFEYCRYRPLMVQLLVFLVLFVGILSVSFVFGPENVLEITFVVKGLALPALSTGAFVIGMLILTRDHLLGTRHRAFLFARPLETRHMARARLRALLRVTVILLCAAVLVEGVHQWALHAEAREERARVSERRGQRGPSPHMGLPSREQMESEYPREPARALEREARISFAEQEWLIIAAAFAVLIWSCLSDPVAVAVILLGPVLLAEFVGLGEGASTILFYAFAALFAGLYLYTAWVALRQDLVRWRTVALCVAASVVVLLVTPSDAPEWWGGPALPRPRPFAAMVLIAPLLPFTVIPLWLHRQRHR